MTDEADVLLTSVSEPSTNESAVLTNQQPGITTSNHSSSEHTNESSYDLGNSSAEYDVVEAPYGSPVVHDLPSDSLDHRLMEEPRAAKFIVGTPQSHSDYLSSHEHFETGNWFS